MKCRLMNCQTDVAAYQTVKAPTKVKSLRKRVIVPVIPLKSPGPGGVTIVGVGVGAGRNTVVGVQDDILELLEADVERYLRQHSALMEARVGEILAYMHK